MKILKSVIALLMVCGVAYAADVKIKDLPSDTSPASTDMIPKTDGSTTKQSTIANILKNETDPKAGAVNGIVKSNGSGTFTAVTDNSTNWNTAYSQTRQWDGGSTGLTASTGRSSLGIGSNYAMNAGTLTDGKGCKYTSSGTQIDCNQTYLTAETDATALAKTINSKALSTNPVLNASDVGLGNVPNVNWQSLNAIQSSAINWSNISTLAPIQSGGVNWVSLSNAIQTGGVNWSSVKNQEIQTAGINWSSVTAVTPQFARIGLGTAADSAMLLNATSTRNPANGVIEKNIYSTWTPATYPANSTVTNIYGEMLNNGSVSSATTHGIGVYGNYQDTASGALVYGIGTEGAARGYGSSKYYGLVGHAYYFNDTTNSAPITAGVASAVEITKLDGTTPLNSGVAASFYATPIVGGVTGGKFGVFVNDPILQQQDNIGTTLTKGIILKNATTGTIQLAPYISFIGNAYAGVNYDIEWQLGHTNVGGSGADFSLTLKSTGLSLNSTVLNIAYDGTTFIQGSVKAMGGYKSSDGTAGMTGSCTSLSGKTLTIKNGLITACA